MYSLNHAAQFGDWKKKDYPSGGVFGAGCNIDKGQDAQDSFMRYAHLADHPEAVDYRIKSGENIFKEELDRLLERRRTGK